MDKLCDVSTVEKVMSEVDTDELGSVVVTEEFSGASLETLLME